MRLVHQIMADLLPDFETLDPPVVFETHLGDFNGQADHMAVWFAFADRSAKLAAEASGLTGEIRNSTLEAFRRHEYPEDALDTLFIGFTSAEEIDEGGGSFYYFR